MYSNVSLEVKVLYLRDAVIQWQRSVTLFIKSVLFERGTCSKTSKQMRSLRKLAKHKVLDQRLKDVEAMNNIELSIFSPWSM